MKRKKITKKMLILGLLGLLVIGVGGRVLYVYYNHKNPAPVAAPTGTSSGTINYGPPTETDKQETQANKDNLANQSKQDNSGSKTATPILVNAFQNDSQITVSGFVQGVIENNGTCTYTFTKDSLKVTKTATGSANASNTSCPIVNVARSEFSQAGDWQVTLSYSSASASGVSSPKTLTLQ